ncbi:hypothetical protein [Paucibacter sp. M5-1]|uniref:hypothetical protein n=1 Tax=Paucibacter sp. M5-1 TaxID=3015998 RepID=UPI0022B8A5B4|nr:hypothetical protein [Paucibacter sp. M5-1]MCZ7879844.1 hypothetical protein [Paucibacter sp. M5-1]
MKRFQAPRLPARQRGVVLVFALIALVLLLVGAAAMMRSMNVSLTNAGNIGFKRDLTNQGELAMNQVVDVLSTGNLRTEAARLVANKAENYSEVILPTNPQGVPLALLTDTAFAEVGVATRDIKPADTGVEVRYVIDRLCSDTGAVDPSRCSMAGPPPPSGVSWSERLRAEDSSSAGAGAVPLQVVYRVSIRVNGPRGTQSFFQSTFTNSN